MRPPISASPTDSETSRTRTHLPSHTPSPHTLSHSPPTNAPGHGHTGRSQVKFQTGPVPGGQRETEKAGHARMRGGGFQAGELTYEAGLRHRETETPRPPARISTVHSHRGLGGVRSRNHPDGLKPPCFPKAASLEQLPLRDECTFQGQGRGEEPPMASGRFMGHPAVTSLNDLSQRTPARTLPHARARFPTFSPILTLTRAPVHLFYTLILHTHP